MKTVKVQWTPAFQSYHSAGDEAEAYCDECETTLEDDFKYCPICGSKLDWEREEAVQTDYLKTYNELRNNLHVDCSSCYSENVTCLGPLLIDEKGAYLEVKCNECNYVDFVGDGDYFNKEEQ